MEEALARDDARQRDDERCGSDSRRGDERQPGAEADGLTRQDSDGHRKGRQSNAVDQPEHEQGEAEGAHTGGAPRIASDDRDPDDLVESPRQGDPVTEAPPFAAASASGCGRSSAAKSRCQP